VHDLHRHAEDQGQMEYAKLGESDLEVSRIGFGCWAIGGHGYGRVEDRESVGAIQKALDLGVNFFDTADVYGFGHSEEVLSGALGSKRHDVVVATKFGVCWDEKGATHKDSSPRRVVEALEASLRRLKLDCIPLYQIHHHDGRIPIEETMQALLRCREEGKIKYIGCCNLAADRIKTARTAGEMVSVQTLFNIIERENGALLRDCSGVYHMGTIVYGALMRGLFSGNYGVEAVFGEKDTRSVDDNFRCPKLGNNLCIVEQLKKLGRNYKKSSAQVALRWVLDSPFITSIIVGAKSAKQVIDNAGAVGWQLTDDHWRFLDELTAR
jgi:myo-inositol catabolism protein IolS